MSQFGKFRPSDPVVSQDNLLNLHLKVSSVEELGHYPNNTIAVFTDDDGALYLYLTTWVVSLLSDLLQTFAVTG